MNFKLLSIRSLVGYILTPKCDRYTHNIFVMTFMETVVLIIYVWWGRAISDVMGTLS